MAIHIWASMLMLDGGGRRQVGSGAAIAGTEGLVVRADMVTTAATSFELHIVGESWCNGLEGTLDSQPS